MYVSNGDGGGDCPGKCVGSLKPFRLSRQPQYSAECQKIDKMHLVRITIEWNKDKAVLE
jgi:hypothetical protein